MKCQRCESESIMAIDAKCSDCCIAEFKGMESDGYVPHDIGIGNGGGDMVVIKYCLNCGQLQGEWPIRDPDTSEDNGWQKIGE